MITVVGSLNLDLVVRVERMPEPGETLAATGYAEQPGGKGANQAVAAARAAGGSDGRVRMIGRVGRDDAGRGLRDGLAADRIDVGEVREADAPTGRAFIEVDAHGRNRIVIVAGANAAWGPDDLPDPLVAPGDTLLLQREVPDSVVAAAARAAATAGARVVLNLAPAGRVDPDVLAATDVLIVNESEAALTLDRPTTAVADDVDRAAHDLAERVGGDVVLTLGAQGAAFAGTSGVGRVPGFAAETVDTTAAGDAFVGALAARLEEGADLPEAVRFACAAGAEAVTREGAQPSLPTRDAIEARLTRSA